MTKREIKSLISRANKLKAEIATKRDALRDLVSDIEDIEAGCDEAVECLERAADKMSELL
jgi:uncharacterized protein YoxC